MGGPQAAVPQCPLSPPPHPPVLLPTCSFAPQSPFHVHPAKLRTGITSFHTPQRPDVGVHLSLYPSQGVPAAGGAPTPHPIPHDALTPSGHVGFFAHHPAPMPDATLRLVHLPSEYPILQVGLPTGWQPFPLGCPNPVGLTLVIFCLVI